jgi:hypothetical protein
MDRPARVTLVVFFNERFESNIEKLDRLYGGRFSSIVYVMPFSKIQDERVVAVSELGWYFSGHLAQAKDRIVATEAESFIFIGDDLIINPEINEENIHEFLGIAPSDAYIKGIAHLDALRYCWPWAGEVSLTYRKSCRGLNSAELLPTVEQSERNLRKLGISAPRPIPKSLREVKYLLWDLPRLSKWKFLMHLGILFQRTEYPMVAGYSDFLVVPRQAVDQFLYYCGVFSAMNIFAEVAVPTSLVLAAESIRTELPINQHFMEARSISSPRFGVELWSKEKRQDVIEALEGRLENLNRVFKPGQIYCHPIKLSQLSWN